MFVKKMCAQRIQNRCALETAADAYFSRHQEVEIILNKYSGGFLVGKLLILRFVRIIVGEGRTCAASSLDTVIIVIFQ